MARTGLGARQRADVGQPRSAEQRIREGVRDDVPVRVPDEADVLLEPLVGWAVRALLGEPTLDGLVNSLEETQIEWAAEPADHLYAAAAVDFTAQFPTAVADPDALS